MTEDRTANDAGAARDSWKQRLRPFLIPAGYIAVALILGLAGRITGSIAMLNVAALMGQPMMALSLETLGAWPALAFGVLVNAGAIALVIYSLGRFSSRSDGMSDLALRVLGRDK